MLPEARERWQTALALCDRYALHQRGVTYAMQGYHTGDGVSIQSGILRTHALIMQIEHEVKQSPEYQKSSRKRKERRGKP